MEASERTAQRERRTLMSRSIPRSTAPLVIPERKSTGFPLLIDSLDFLWQDWNHHEFRRDEENQEVEKTAQRGNTATTENKVHWVDIFLFSMCAIGVSVGWTGILSGLSYFAKIYGKSSFLWLNLATYLPTLPVAIAQTRWDELLDRKYSSRRAYFVRCVISMLGMLVCIILVPIFAVDESRSAMVHILALNALIGFFSSVVYGSFYQIASLIPSRGTLQAAFAMGYQGSGLVVLIFSLSLGFNANASSSVVWSYFLCIAAVEAASLLAFLVMIFWRQTFVASLQKRDLSVAKITSSESADEPTFDSAGRQPLLSSIAEDPRLPVCVDGQEENSQSRFLGLSSDIRIGDDDIVAVESFANCRETTHAPTKQSASSSIKNDRRGPGTELSCDAESPLPTSYLNPSGELTLWQIYILTYPSVVAIFLTVLGALVCLPLYTYVPSRGGKDANLSQKLFYVKLGCDMLGRPATILLRRFHTPRRMLAAAFLRLLFLPIFFAYTFADIIPRSDIGAMLGVGIFSFSSGYINTVAYQLAPLMIPASSRDVNGARVANLINTAFHAAVYAGLLVSVVVFFVGTH